MSFDTRLITCVKISPGRLIFFVALATLLLKKSITFVKDMLKHPCDAAARKSRSGCPKKFFEALRRAPQLDKWIHLARATERIPGGLFGRTCGQYGFVRAEPYPWERPSISLRRDPCRSQRDIVRCKLLKSGRKLNNQLRFSIIGLWGGTMSPRTCTKSRTTSTKRPKTQWHWTHA